MALHVDELAALRDREITPRDPETWNTCPGCRHTWTDRVPTPGVVHRTQRCAACRRKAAEA